MVHHCGNSLIEGGTSIWNRPSTVWVACRRAPSPCCKVKVSVWTRRQTDQPLPRRLTVW